MDLINIYQCFCDRTRLRILHVLTQGPLCVCHFQEILEEPQVKISKHLAYLRAKGMVETRRNGNFIVYALPEKPPAELQLNLRCLQDCGQSDPIFRADLRKVNKLQESCCQPAAKLSPSRRALLKTENRTAAAANAPRTCTTNQAERISRESATRSRLRI